MSVARRVLIAGTPVDLCSPSEFVDLTTQWAGQEQRTTVFGINAHVVNLCAKNATFADAIAQSDLNFPDGQSIIWAAAFRKYAHGGRVPLTHMTEAMCSSWAAAGRRVYLLGGQPGVAERAAAKLSERYQLEIAGTHDGFFDGADDAVIKDVNASGADIVLIGLGNPKQEIWTHAHRDELAPAVAMTCGGWLDWTAGERKPCPPWIYRMGMEWAYRLLQEPRRLFVRYVVGNPSFVLRVLRAGRIDRIDQARIPAPRVGGSTVSGSTVGGSTSVAIPAQSIAPVAEPVSDPAPQ